ncbi:NAD(P)-dependent oxidoreductase [Paenibacillus abyssi]|uniref:3-hydroxyisobutyrate dehydrogenase n=1 Tax=Paenibacillus abyssi TaxID=1340531 RepID=A0A917CJE9_9BACL|nr:NAD(P)-dependent oxidoreductase [Paenibacillus abyssi]GGF90689.1 3-hydroxyisobutyrate dehydrogenase [Paenibacillus abyssi]
MSDRTIGFLGLGAMGLPMARNLLEKGFELHIAAHRNREPVEELKQAGAIEHESPAEVAQSCGVLISILPADKEMAEVLLDEKVLDGLGRESVLIEMTSGSPDMMKRIASAYEERGIRVLDAPVSGGTAGAEKGTLTVMAGGQEKVLDTVRPVLESMAKNIFLVGPVGSGKAIKAINQMLAAIHMAAAGEALALARKLEVPVEILKEVIGKSSGASWMLMNKLDGLVKGNFTPGFKHHLMTKDVQIAVDESAELELPLAGLALKLYRDTESEAGELDFSAVAAKLLT